MGGSSKQTVGYRYYMGLHFGLCHGPVDKLTQINVGDREAWVGDLSTSDTISISKRDLFGGDKKEGGIIGDMDVLMGGPTQPRNDYLASKLGGFVPAFRGILSAVWKGGQVSANNPYIKPWAFRVQRITQGWDGGAAWYPSKAAIPLEEVTVTVPATSTWEYKIVNGVLDPANPGPPPSSGYEVGQAPFGFNMTGNLSPVIPIKTMWQYNQTLWLQKEIQFIGDQLIITGRVENAAIFYLDGQVIGSVNPTNVNIGVPSGQPFEIRVNRGSEPQGGRMLHILVLDDVELPGLDDTYFFAEVKQQSISVSLKGMNPAHIVYECLTNSAWGMGYPATAIDTATFTAAADKLFDEQFGLCMLWNKQETIEAFIRIVLEHAGGILYVDPTTGKFALKLIRDDYDASTLPVFGPSNLVSASDYQRQAWGETANEVTATFRDVVTNKDSSITVQDLANIQTQGAVVAQSKQYTGIPTASLAQRVAMRDLNAVSTPLARVRLVANRQAWSLIPGDVFRLNWPEFNVADVVFRVLEINRGTLQDGTITIEAVEDVFGLPSNTYVVTQGSDWVDPISTPQSSARRLIVEAPYWDIVRTMSQADLAYVDDLSGYLETLAARPSDDAINYEINTRTGAAEYDERAVGEFCPTAVLSEAINKTATAITFEDAVDVDLVEPGGYAIIGDEYVGITAVDANARTVTIMRGVLDTTPNDHAAGARIWFADGYQGNDPTEYAAGETVDVKLLPRTGLGELAINLAPEDSITMNRRQNRPYPPGNFLIDSLQYPALISDAVASLTWAHRDRLSQTADLIAQSVGNIGPEPGVTYTVQVFGEAGPAAIEQTGIAGTSSNVDLSVLPTETATVKVWSVRGGVMSWQPAQHTFNFTVATLFAVLPLTYDEDDHAGVMTWTRQGVGPHVTPLGFEGDGWNARLKSTTIPAWLSPAASRLSIQASIRFSPLRVMNTGGDTVVHLGADAAGVVPNPKLAIRVLPDPDDARFNYLALQSFTSALQTMPLCRSGWHHRGNYPVQTFGGNQLRPQGILFLDANTLLVMAHAENTENVVHQIDLTTNTVTGSFSFGDPPIVGTHLAGMARRANGDLWMAGYSNRVVRVNLAASLASGAAQIEHTITVSDMNGLGAIEFMTLGGAERLILAEYNNDNDDADLAIFDTSVLSGSTLSRTAASKVFNVGRRVQGICARSGELALSRNRKWGGTTTATTLGWVEFYDIAGMFASLATGSAVHAGANAAYLLRSELGASSLVQDMSVHPTTNDLWGVTEGWQDVGDWPGFAAIWSSPVDGSAVENHITATFDGLGTVSAKLNGRPASSAPWTPTATVAAVSVGGPPSQSAEFVHGFFKGFVKNVRIQNKPIDAAQYAETVAGTTFEPNTLTAYTITLTNPGAESGVTGWTNETGTLATRATAPTPFAGAAYFNGGANAQTIARQRVDLLAATGLTGAQVDAGGIWAKLRWAQASFTDQDPATMGVRTLNGSSTQIALTYGHVDFVPFGDSGATPNWQTLASAVNLPSGTRFVDAVYRSDRTSGTNNDGYIDAISLVIYRR